MEDNSAKKSRQVGVWVRFTITIVVAIIIPLVIARLS